MIFRRSFVLGLGALAAAAPDQSVPVDMLDGRCTVPVQLDGELARFVLDTGAEATIVSAQAMSRLRLRPDPWIGTTLRGAGGQLERHANVVVRAARLGGVALVQHPDRAGLNCPVTTAPLGGADGLLGGDVLRHFTLFLDVPRGRMALLPFAMQPQAGVALTPWRMSLLLAPVRLAGRPLTALVDTGAARTLLNARGAYRMGLAPEKALPTVRSWAIGGAVTATVRRFDELRVGQVAVKPSEVLCADVPEAAFDMTLGLDVLGRQPLFLSYSHNVLTLL